MSSMWLDGIGVAISNDGIDLVILKAPKLFSMAI